MSASRAQKKKGFTDMKNIDEIMSKYLVNESEIYTDLNQVRKKLDNMLKGGINQIKIRRDAKTAAEAEKVGKAAYDKLFKKISSVVNYCESKYNYKLQFIKGLKVGDLTAQDKEKAKFDAEDDYYDYSFFETDIFDSSLSLYFDTTNYTGTEKSADIRKDIRKNAESQAS